MAWTTIPPGATGRARADQAHRQGAERRPGRLARGLGAVSGRRRLCLARGAARDHGGREPRPRASRSAPRSSGPRSGTCSPGALSLAARALLVRGAGQGPLVGRPDAIDALADPEPRPGRRDGAWHAEAGRVHAPADAEQLQPGAGGLRAVLRLGHHADRGRDDRAGLPFAVELDPAYVDVAVRAGRRSRARPLVWMAADLRGDRRRTPEGRRHEPVAHPVAGRGGDQRRRRLRPGGRPRSWRSSRSIGAAGGSQTRWSSARSSRPSRSSAATCSGGCSTAWAAKGSTRVEMAASPSAARPGGRPGSKGRAGSHPMRTAALPAASPDRPSPARNGAASRSRCTTWAC
jgi:hypothetical protein